MPGFSIGLAPVAAAALMLLPSRARIPGPTGDDAARAETIERMVRAADLEVLYARSIEASIATQIGGNATLAPYAGPLRDFVAAHASFASRRLELIHAYRETFSEAEAEETIRFCQSSFGRRLMSMLPALMARTGEPGAEWVHAHLTELLATGAVERAPGAPLS
jgi:Uncharacterized protein conserved in bacteria (DUF2059)